MLLRQSNSFLIYENHHNKKHTFTELEQHSSYTGNNVICKNKFLGVILTTKKPCFLMKKKEQDNA